MMVATLLEPDLAGLERAIRTLDPSADVFEIRFDALSGTVEPRQVRALTKKPLIGTFRRVADGGTYGGPETERLATLEACLDAGFEHVDVEGPVTVPGPEERMIRSRHEWRATPSTPTILRTIEELGRNGATAKFASNVQSLADTLTLLGSARQLQANGRPFAVMGMGPFPRLLAHLVGSRLVYGGGRTNAPGQPALQELVAQWNRWGRPSAARELFLVVGEPVDRSLSPALHNAAFRADQRDAAYGALTIPNGHELEMLLDRAADLHLGGLSVTTPLKDAAFDLVERRTPEAERAHAVNAIRVEDGRPIGHNTDGTGAARVADRLVEGNGRILVVGPGGAGRAIATSLPGHEVVLAGRTRETLRRWERDLGVATETLANASLHVSDFDLLINATASLDPLPMHEYRGALFDLHYLAPELPWRLHATRHGLKFADGREQLLEQGVDAYRFWTGHEAPRAPMRDALEAQP